ncbi:MAG TPA: bifunctional ADP-heptose synthase [Bacteroidales bacterium]|mgnify:CR=1 FL=1|nr:bifunctional ADP-heptose synthase [Bacteroidales bacterium]
MGIFTNKEEISDLLESFSGRNVLIVGDVMVDAYLFGKVDRISPEAPVPVVTLSNRQSMLGGAANVALNIKALGANPLLCSVIGDDTRGAELIGIMNDNGLDTNGMYASNDRITTTKFRIIGNRFQMLRVDEETDSDLTATETKNLLERLDMLLHSRKPSVIILQDYNKGVLTAEVIDQIMKKALHAGIPVVVDPKKKNFRSFRSVTLFKPNLKEIRDALGIDINPRNEESLKTAAIKLHDMLDARQVMITLSELGVFMSCRTNGTETSFILPAHVRAIADVSGAGDTVVSVAALCTALGVSPEKTAWLSNLAGGLVCEQVGVVPVDRNKLIREAQSLC